MIVAGLARYLAVDGPARRLKVEHRHHRFEQRRAHPAAFAGAVAFVEGHQDADGEVQAG